MDNSGTTPGTPLDATLEVFTSLGRPCTPLTATDVAEELGCERRTARHKLAQLVERGDLHSREIEAGERVWWRPADVATSGGMGERRSDLRQFAETVRDDEEYAVFETDPDGTVTSWDEGAERITGYDEAEIVGEHFSSLYTEEAVDRGVPARNLEVAAETGRTEDDGRLVSKDGSEFWASTVIIANHDEDGSLRGFTNVTQDLTERKERERELQKYKAAVDAARDGIVVCDAAGTCRLVNDAFAEGVGLPKESIVDQPVGALEELEFVDDRVVETGTEKTIDLFLSDQDQTQFETTIESPVHGEMVVEANISLLPPETDDKLVGGVVAIVRPITERKRLKKQLSETVEKLKESNERLEQFAYVASHDLQEPLRMISSYLQLLENRYADELDEDAREFVDFAVDGANRMNDMIEGLLEYSRVETQGDPLVPIEMEAVVDDVLTDLQFQIDEKNADITVEALPRVEGDAGQLRQLFQNLLDNAIVYCGNEPPWVHVSAEGDGDEWIVSVSDDGIGIEPEHQDRIFDVFQRLHTDDEQTGTGIGLALCQKIVERHEGRIWVESEPGEGSTFCFTVPTCEDD